MKIVMAYFSATQNTAKIGEVIRNRITELGAEIDTLDVTTPPGRETVFDMASYQGAIFGSPIHFMRAPKIFREWLGGLEGKGKPCALFFTYGGFQVHPAHKTTADILSRNGFRIVASAEFPGKHTYNIVGWQAMVDRPDESDLKVAREYAEVIYNRMAGLDPDSVGELPMGLHTLEELDKMEANVPQLFPRRPGREEADCEMCMLCEEMCPTGAMDAETGEADANACMFCLRCTQVCPEEAISFVDLSEFFSHKMEMDKETPESLRKKESVIYR
jgi:ferredoxin/menaquinone-dependent protoporphyrinogen IX oxidase